VFSSGGVEDQVVPVADAREQVEAQQRAKTEDRQRLTLRIGMDGVGLDLGFVPQQPFDGVNGLPHPSGDESAEEGDVGVGDVPVGDPAVPGSARVPDSWT
jgi:hypothetical protein